MIKRELNHFDILEAKKAYKEGKNITELLRLQKNIETNTSEIIETAYDLQAGSYIEYVTNNAIKSQAYTLELSEILCRHLNTNDSLIDIGTGEMTTLSHILTKLKIIPNKIFAFDISWSRIYNGIIYSKKILGEKYKIISPFVADINEIPLLDKSINITTSSHALEPNGGKLKELLTELFRITIDKLILFEPCFEINSEDGKKRMEKLGYIKNIDGVVEELGGKLIEKIIIKNTSNPMNPTVCFVIIPPLTKNKFFKTNKNESRFFSAPGTNIPIKEFKEYYFSNQLGLCYPKIKNIPILKSNASILASSLCE